MESRVKIHPKVVKWADPAGGALWLLLGVILSPGWDARGLLFLSGAGWAALAWRLGLSQTLMQSLQVVASRMPETASLPPALRLAPALGILAWSLALWKPGRWMAMVVGLMWAMVALIAPPLWPLVLAGYPRLGRSQGDHATLARLPGLFLLLAALGAALIGGGLPSQLLLFLTSENYVAWGRDLIQHFQTPSLWRALPVVALFEVAQRQPGDIRITWRNVCALGALASLLFMTPAHGLGLIAWVALPLGTITLTRWFLALPSIPRIIFGTLLFLHALPLLHGGTL